MNLTLNPMANKTTPPKETKPPEEENKVLRECIKGLQVYFDYTNIEHIGLRNQLGRKNYAKFINAWNLMYNQIEI